MRKVCRTAATSKPIDRPCLLDVQHAHDILHAVVVGEVPIVMDEVTRASLHAAHDALGWVLGFPCGEEGFEESLRRVLREVERIGGLFVDSGTLQTDDERNSP